MVLAIIIVNYRTPQLIVDCLVSLLPEIAALDAKVVVVDNCSGDDSLSIIGTWLHDHDAHRQVELLAAPTNGGFASGNNIGIRAVSASYYLLLNSDALVRPGAIAMLLETARSHPDAGLFSPRLEWPDGRGQESCFRFHTPVSEFMGAAHTGIIDRLLQRFVVYWPVQTEIAMPEWTSFACVMIRHDVLDVVGLLDEGYFMYFEDMAFCRKARQAGWVVVHNPAARVVHLRGGTSTVKASANQKKRVPRYYYESRARYFYQFYGIIGLWVANLLWWCGRAIAKTRLWLGHRDKTAVERQWLDIWTNCLAPLRPYTAPKTQTRE